MHALHHGLELLLHSGIAGIQAGTHISLQVGAPIAQAAQTAAQSASHVYPDTIITKQVTAEPGFWGQIAAVVRVLLSIALLALAAGLFLVMWNLRKVSTKVDALLDRFHSDVVPLIRNVNIVSDDAREIVASVKGDARMVQQTVAAANTRLLKAVRQTEERIDRFNALLEVVQEEAESTFISTAATVRGVRTGFGQIFTNEGDDDGDIGDERSHETGAPYAGPARPRVRPK